MKINPLTNPTGDQSAVRFTTEYPPINPETKRGYEHYKDISMVNRERIMEPIPKFDVLTNISFSINHR